MDYSPFLERLDVHLVHRPMPAGWWGLWDQGDRVITVNRHLGPIQRRCTIFHELGHAHYGHRGTTGRAELEADAWAARQLIDPGEWRYLTTIHADLLTVAAELQVLPRIAAVYAKHLARHPTMRHH